MLEVLTVYAHTVCGAWGGFWAAKGNCFYGILICIDYPNDCLFGT